MNRTLLIKAHLIIAGLFLPFLVFIPVSGGLYLFGEKGSFSKGESFVVNEKLPEDKVLFETRVREIFNERSIEYKFAYASLRDGGADLRPTSKPHYKVRQSNNQTTFTHFTPSFQAHLMELHKGHGPPSFKWLQMFFAIGLLCLGISGLVLAFSLTKHRKPLFISGTIGLILFLILHNI